MEQMQFLIELKSMIGLRKGRLCLHREEDRLNARFDFPGNTAHASGSITDAGGLHLSGTFQTFYRSREFAAEGILKGNDLRLQLEMNGEKYSLEGRKILNEEAI